MEDSEPGNGRIGNFQKKQIEPAGDWLPKGRNHGALNVRCGQV
jgi:hypothetical protein